MAGNLEGADLRCSEGTSTCDPVTLRPEPAQGRSFDDDEWSADMADDFLRRNGGENGSDVVPIPEIMFAIDRKAEEHLFLLEGGISGRTALMRRFPFSSIGTTPEAVFDRVGFFVDGDGTFEMHRILDFEELKRQIEAAPDMRFRRWKDFQSMAGTLRAFSSVLSITDASDDWDTPEAEDARIRGVMKGMAAMASGTLLRDREPEPDTRAAPEPGGPERLRTRENTAAGTAAEPGELPTRSVGIYQIAAALEERFRP